MSPTPADIHNISFKKPPIGKRGYDEEEVDAFLDETERELARLIEENSQLRDQVGPRDDNGGDDQLRSELADLRTQIERVRREQAAAEQATRTMRAELEQARHQGGGEENGANGANGARVLMMAQRTADDHTDEARRQVDQLLTEAHTKADEILREAMTRADSLERQARERHEQAIGTLDDKRNDLVAQLDGMAAFAGDYRHRLREVLTSQLDGCSSGIPS
jgi:DivIVA domain-containing protein